MNIAAPFPVAAPIPALPPVKAVSPAFPLPLTLTERAELPDKISVKATFEEYVDFAAECEYTVEYSDGKIINMGLASISHEAFVSRLNHLLTVIFGLDTPYHLLGSNVATFIPDAGAIHNADLVVVKGKAETVVYQGKKKKVTALTNPHLLVEVLSRSTHNYDLGTKVLRYKTLPSVQHILLVEHRSPYVALFSRTKKPGEWLNTETTDVEQGYVTIHRKRLYLKKIYQNIAQESTL